LRKTQAWAKKAGFFLAVCYFFSWQSLRADDFARGRVVDAVACLDDASQSYALFLPTTYQPDRRFPVIYCFDPGGRGAVPVALFSEGAEKFGYILVGSVNARNGPWEVILKAARAIWRDTRSRFAIDQNRIYAAGFSGGARAACGLGKMLSIKLAGVIGCGAGLPEWLVPEDIADVPWFGTVGLHDFNYGEMQELERELSAQKTPCQLKIFMGAHSWPPAKVALAAIEWLEEQGKEAAGPPHR
jgi:dienelactone hydrolase